MDKERFNPEAEKTAVLERLSRIREAWEQKRNAQSQDPIYARDLTAMLGEVTYLAPFIDDKTLRGAVDAWEIMLESLNPEDVVPEDTPMVCDSVLADVLWHFGRP